ncbi:unnamed protein product [Cochlearia groenlandica]
MEEDRKEKNTPWLSVPQFGDWEQKGGEGGGKIPDYSMDFTKIREMRKQNKRDPSRASLGNEEELVKPPETATTPTYHAASKLTTEQHHFSPGHHHHQPHSPSRRRSIFSCFSCCVKA